MAKGTKKPRRQREPRMSEEDVRKIVRAVRRNHLQELGIHHELPR